MYNALNSLTLLLIDHLKPFKNAHWLCTHMVKPFEQCWQQAVLPFKSIQMVLEGPLIHHLEVSKQGFVLADLPFKTIWGNQHCTQLFHHSKPQQRMVSNGASTCTKKGTKSRRVNAKH